MIDLASVNVQILSAIGDAGRSESRGLIVGHYSISFSGFMRTPQATNRLVGVIKAWPVVDRKPGDGLPTKYICGIVRGRGWGEYYPGDYWDLRAPEDALSITAVDLESPEALEYIIEEILHGIDIVVGYAREVIAGRQIPEASRATVLTFDSRTGEVINPHIFSPEVVKNVYVRPFLSTSL